MTAQHLIDLEQFSEQDQEAIAVVVNDTQAKPHTTLADGDRVELLVNIAGGSLPGRGKAAVRLDRRKMHDRRDSRTQGNIQRA